MFTEELAAARTALEAVARGFDSSCSGRDAVRVVEQMGTIHRLADAVTVRAAKRIADTNAHVARGNRCAAELCARLVGVGSGDAKRAIDNATRLESLPAVDAAFREGRLSARGWTHRPMEPGLVVLGAPQTKNRGLAPRPTRPRHRKATTRPTRHIPRRLSGAVRRSPPAR
jgi:hypothetical protein